MPIDLRFYVALPLLSSSDTVTDVVRCAIETYVRTWIGDKAFTHALAVAPLAVVVVDRVWVPASAVEAVETAEWPTKDQDLDLSRPARAKDRALGAILALGRAPVLAVHPERKVSDNDVDDDDGK